MDISIAADQDPTNTAYTIQDHANGISGSSVSRREDLGRVCVYRSIVNVSSITNSVSNTSQNGKHNVLSGGNSS